MCQSPVQADKIAMAVVFVSKREWFQLLALTGKNFLQVQYTWCTTAANHKLKHHLKKIKINHRTYFIFYFEISYSLYTSTFAETLSRKAAVNYFFWRTFDIFPPLLKKLNHSVIYIVLLSSLAGFGQEIND